MLTLSCQGVAEYGVSSVVVGTAAETPWVPALARYAPTHVRLLWPSLFPLKKSPVHAVYGPDIRLSAASPALSVSVHND